MFEECFPFPFNVMLCFSYMVQHVNQESDLIKQEP